MSKGKLVWAELTLGLLSFLDKVIPAALLAWNSYLRNKNERLEAKISVLKEQKKLKKEMERINEKYQNKDPISVIDSYLVSRELRRRQDDKPR